jgi:hypothetical protein
MSSYVERGTSIGQGEQTKSRDRIWNLLTILVLLATICLVAFFVLTFNNPYNTLNPFPPAFPSATFTATPRFPPTWTPTFTPEPTATRTPKTQAEVPTAEPGATAVDVTTIVADVPPTEAPTPAQGYPFQLRGEMNSVKSTIIHPDQGCKWLGVGGEVFDFQGSPLVGLTIQVGGGLNGRAVNMISLTGTATQYGPAGYEFTLGEMPVDSQGRLWLQLLDQAGLPLSQRFTFNTSSDCNQNLVLVNFKQVR